MHVCLSVMCPAVHRRLRNADILEAPAVAANGSRRGADVVGQKEPEVGDRPIATSTRLPGGEGSSSCPGRDDNTKK